MCVYVYMYECTYVWVCISFKMAVCPMCVGWKVRNCVTRACARSKSAGIDGRTRMCVPVLIIISIIIIIFFFLPHNPNNLIRSVPSEAALQLVIKLAPDGKVSSNDLVDANDPHSHPHMFAWVYVRLYVVLMCVCTKRSSLRLFRLLFLLLRILL